MCSSEPFVCIIEISRPLCSASDTKVLSRALSLDAIVFPAGRFAAAWLKTISDPFTDMSLVFVPFPFFLEVSVVSCVNKCFRE